MILLILTMSKAFMLRPILRNFGQNLFSARLELVTCKVLKYTKQLIITNFFSDGFTSRNK